MKRPKGGDIFEMPLLLNMGYGYAKYLNPPEIWGETNIPAVLRVFSYRSLEKLDTVDLIADELLLAPIWNIGLGWYL